jgi:hypothetical protein
MNENAIPHETMYGDTACRRVRSAIENWYLCGGDGTDARPIINALKMDPDLTIIVPVQISGSFLGNTPPEEVKAGDVFVLEEEMRMEILKIALKGGAYLTPVFTDLDEMMKGEGTDSITMLFSELLEMALSWENCAGIVINPWGNGFVLTRELLEAMRGYKPQSWFTVVKGDITRFTATPSSTPHATACWAAEASTAPSTAPRDRSCRRSARRSTAAAPVRRR